MANVGASNGGCWYCGDDQGEMYFSSEFDTYLHLKCLQKEINFHDPDDMETKIMAREFDEILNPPTILGKIKAKFGLEK